MEREQLFIEKVQEGDKDAFKELILIYQARIYNLAFHYTKNKQDASDLFQDTWLKALSQIGKYSFKYKFYSWICRILVNTYIDKYTAKSHQKRELSIPEDYNNTSESSVLEEIVTNQEKRKIISAIHQLPDEYRIVVAMIDLEGFSRQEAAKVTNMSESGVRSRLSRGREKVREILKNFGTI